MARRLGLALKPYLKWGFSQLTICRPPSLKKSRWQDFFNIHFRQFYDKKIYLKKNNFLKKIFVVTFFLSDFENIFTYLSDDFKMDFLCKKIFSLKNVWHTPWSPTASVPLDTTCFWTDNRSRNRLSLNCIPAKILNRIFFSHFFFFNFFISS